MKIDYILCLSGIAILAVTLYRQYLLAANGTNNVFQTVLFATAGIFLFLHSLGGLLVKYAGWKVDLIMLDHLRINYPNYAKLMTAMTLLVLLGVYLLGLTVIYFDDRDLDQLLIGNNYDLVFDTPIAADGPILVGIGQNDIVEQNVVLFAHGLSSYNGGECLVISETDYTRLTGNVLNLERETVQVILQDAEETFDWIGAGTLMQITVDNRQFAFTVHKQTWAYLFNSQIKQVLILNNDDFQAIDKNILMRKHLLLLQDWTLGKDVPLQNRDNPNIVNIISKYGQYLQEAAAQNSLIFFLALAVAVFFVSLGCLLYFKISNDIPSIMDRNRFLQNIGVHAGNIRQSTQNNYKLFL